MLCRILTLRIRRQPVCPSIPQIAQALRFAVDSDVLVERDRFTDGEEIRRRKCADLFELADAVVLLAARSHQRPSVFDPRLPHVKKTGAHRRECPLVQAHAVVIAVEIGDLERKLAEGVRAVHNRDDAPRLRHVADAPHREDQSRAVRDVAKMNDFGLRRDRLLESPVQIVRG